MIQSSNTYQHLIRNELHVLQRVNHPNISSTMSLLQDDHFYFIFSELARYGDLRMYLQRRIDAKSRVMSESEVKSIVIQLLRALNYLHSQNIVHRDIKLENILIDSVSNNRLNVKLADFGFSEKSKDGRLRGLVGSREYMAPEVRSEKWYDGKVDVWGLMVCVIAMLTHQLPKDLDMTIKHIETLLNNDLKEKTRNVLSNQTQSFPFKTQTPLESLSRDALDFLCCGLKKDPESRYTAAELLEHPWISAEVKGVVFDIVN